MYHARRDYLQRFIGHSRFSQDVRPNTGRGPEVMDIASSIPRRVRLSQTTNCTNGAELAPRRRIETHWAPRATIVVKAPEIVRH